MKLNRILFLLLLGIMVVMCRKEDDDITGNETGNFNYNPATDAIVTEKKEIRAAWIATVSNLDWPLTKSNPDAQKAELISLLNLCQTFNFNAVILQVRPTADAFYPSSLEPWSGYLTGVQGQDPGYDPLKFAIDEAHKRGMELHAWLNPYRIGATTLTLASSHVAVKNPSWVVTFSGTRYFNPGMPEVRAHLVAVVKDIVSRYDVDAIHFDDYFYPSGAKATNPFVFDDQAAYNKYGNGVDITTWRNENVNTMVRDVFQAIRSTKPGVLFGISPSGRRENSLDLYADPLVWLENRWVDYLAPQVYWEFGHPTADYGKQTTYWNDNARGVPMVIGVAAYKFKDPAYPAYGTVAEIGKQIDYTRTSQNINGCFFFRVKFLENAELLAYMKTKYTTKSLLPFMGISNASSPGIPAVSLSGNKISWAAVTGATRYAVYLLERDSAKNNTFIAKCVQISADTQFTGESGKSYFVTATNADNTESARSIVVSVKLTT